MSNIVLTLFLEAMVCVFQIVDLLITS